jgi:cysteinyl-tRNA synthetase, unknown class
VGLAYHAALTLAIFARVWAVKRPFNSLALTCGECLSVGVAMMTAPVKTQISITTAAILAVVMACNVVAGGAALAARGVEDAPVLTAPAPKPALRPSRVPANPAPAAAVPRGPTISAAEAEKRRLARMTSAKSWGYQLNGINLEELEQSPYDLLVLDATTGLASGQPFTPEQVARLKRKPDGGTRTVVSYLSIGEAEDYRPDYFTAEYMEEDAPDWLMHENPQWKGNRLIRFCKEGWQLTILGDADGRNVYNSIEASPLYKLIEAGFDGVYLDRVDVYGEITEECTDSRNKMIDFVARLGAHARKKNPEFVVILQNAEELLASPKMIKTIDAVAKESLFYGEDMSQRPNKPQGVTDTVANLKLAQKAGRGVFVVDYVTAKPTAMDAKRKIEAQGFVPYVGPRNLGAMWYPGQHF